jgi:superfamily II DNA or RNA helicase
MGTAISVAQGSPQELSYLATLLTLQALTKEEAFALQRQEGQVAIHQDGEHASISFFNWNSQSFLSGLTSFVVPRCPFPVQVSDETGCKYGEGVDRIHPDMLKGIELRDYQIDAIRNALWHRRGIIEHQPGLGKTEVAVGIATCLDRDEFPLLVLVHTRFLLSQMAERFKKRGFHSVHVYGGGRKEIGLGVNICTIQGFVRGLQTYDPMIAWLAANTITLITDEGHIASSQSFYLAGLSLPRAKNRIGLTMQTHGIPGVVAPEDLYTFGVLGPVIHSLSPSYPRIHGYQSNPVAFILPASGPSYGFLGWHSAYDVGIIKHQHRNSLDVLIAKAASEVGRKVLIFVWRIIHGRALLESLGRLGVPTLYAQGSSVVERWDGDQVVRRRWKFENIQKWVDEPGGKVLIGTPVLDEGVDLPQTDILILSVGGKAFRRLRQRVGRGLRPQGSAYTAVFDHDDAHSLDLVDHAEMRRHIWEYDQIPILPVTSVRDYVGFDVPAYQDVYMPPREEIVEVNLPGMAYQFGSLHDYRLPG